MVDISAPEDALQQPDSISYAEYADPDGILNALGIAVINSLANDENYDTFDDSIGTEIKLDIEFPNNSCGITPFAWEEDRVTLQIAFYEYYKVPWKVFTKFRMSKSQGKFLNSDINKKYDYKKVT